MVYIRSWTGKHRIKLLVQQGESTRELLSVRVIGTGYDEGLSNAKAAVLALSESESERPGCT